MDNTVDNPVIANHPGQVITESMYYGPQNSSMDADAVEYQIGVSNETKQITLGGSVSFNLSMMDFSQDVYIMFSFPQVPINVFVSRGWAFRMIESIELRIGGASNPVYYDWHSLLAVNLAECESRGKTDEMLHLAGETIADGQLAGTVNHGLLLLHAPWSTASGGHQKIPFECTLNKINLRIKTKPATFVFEGVGVGIGLYNPLVDVTYFVKTCRFMNQKLSLSSEIQSGTGEYVYPFYQLVSHTRTFTVTSTTAPTQIAYDSISPGAIESILLWVVKDDKLSNGAGSTLNPIENETISDFTMRIGGKQKYQSQALEYNIVDWSETYHSNKMTSVSLTSVQTQSPFLWKEVETKIISIPFSKNRVYLVPDEAEAVLTYPQALPIQMTFIAPRTGNFTMFLTVLYKALFKQSASSVTLTY